MNETLRRIYKILPSIGAWARSGRANILWSDLIGARAGIAEYVGPRASRLILDSLHIDGEDRKFVTSLNALQAITAMVEAIYDNQQTIDGLFAEDDARAQA